MNVRLEYPMMFTAGVYWNGSIHMNNYSIRLYMITNCADGASQNIAFERMKYFVYSKLLSTVFINCNEVEQIHRMLDSKFKICTLPADPVDQIIGMTIYSKLNAIMEGRILIQEIEIFSDMEENMIYLHAADENLGPLENPGWWKEANLIHYDHDLAGDDKVLAMHHNSVWRELELAWPDNDGHDESGNVVVFADFKNTNDSR